MSNFERATRKRLRFATSVGNITTEDLWDLPLPTLDTLAIQCQAEAEEKTVSFIKKVQAKDSIPQLRFDIVKHVIDVRLDELEATKNRKATAERKQQILAIMQDKKDESLKGASLEDLEKMLEAL